MAGSSVRSFKVEDQVWERVKADAREQGVSASALVRDLLAVYTEPDTFEVIGSTGLPVAATQDSWDGEAAKNRIWEHCTKGEGDDATVDVECVSRAFFYRVPGEDPTIRESYKLGFADIIDGQMQIVPNGVYTAAGGHGVGQADLTPEEKRSVERKICQIYERIEDAPPCPFDRDESALTFTVTGSTDLPVAERETAWDGPGAKTRVFELCTSDSGTVDPDCVSRAFLYRDPDADPATQAAYSLGYADVINGELQIVPRGVAATAGGRGVDATKGIPADEKDRIKSKINSLYNKIREKFPDWPEAPTEENAAMDDETCAECDTFDGVVVDAEGEPVLDDEGNPTPCSCEPDDEDYHEDCVCSADDDGEPTEDDPPQTAAIIGKGSLHTRSKDPETKAAVQRVMELLEEGAVGVSVALDMDPDAMPDPDTLDAMISEERFDEVEEMLRDVPQRLRHLAIVDTAAYSDARMSLGQNGQVEGPMVFEGMWTGDMRYVPYQSVVWDSTLPVPIIWDRQDGDHTGTVVGSISEAERVEDMDSAVRTSEHAIAAAAQTSLLDSIPDEYFTQRKITADSVFTIAAPDAKGLRAVYGLAAPKGVCHRSGDGSQCFQYPGDVDAARFRGFHTGTALTLESGNTVRAGAITLGGMHVDTSLATKGVGVHDIARYRDDANQIFALVRAYETPHGLAVCGVIVPGVTEQQLAQARGCAPSIEMWPSGRGRTLAGIHMVPRPAWPVAASAGGSAMEYSSTVPVELEDPPVDWNLSSVTMTSSGNDRLAAVETSLARIEKALALLAVGAITDVPLPPDGEE